MSKIRYVEALFTSSGSITSRKIYEVILHSTSPDIILIRTDNGKLQEYYMQVGFKDATILIRDTTINDILK